MSGAPERAVDDPDPATDDPGIGTAERIGTNGVQMQGDALGGGQLHGRLPNGVPIDGVSLVSVALGGRILTGTQFQPAGIVGTPFIGTLSNAESISLRIDALSTLSDNPTIWSYAVAFLAQDGWLPLCGLDAAGAPIRAIPVPGTFDHGKGTSTGGRYTPSDTQFTFGCREASIAKCVEFGYTAPARASHLAACTRMMRADYCGDGKSWTLDGTTINFYDGIGLNFDRANWPLEAEWTADGAACVSSTATLRWVGVATPPPACLPAKQSATCGDLAHFTSGTLLMNEYNGR